MNDPASARAILLDIEGTVAPISFVHDVLFPYARQRAEAYLRAHWDDPATAAARALLDQPSPAFSEQSLASLLAAVFRLMDGDVKSTGLKQLQGLIWEEGYRAGAFQSPVYPDVPPALLRWTQDGKIVAIYSSGSIAAQKVFFQHTTAGDLRPFLSAYFDTTTGPKRSASSYTAIAASLGIAAGALLFISDVAEEVEAAFVAGARGLTARRPGNAPVSSGTFDQIETFDDLRAAS